MVSYNPLGADGKIDLDLNRRDHRKLLVVDGDGRHHGGVNVTGVYLNRRAGVSTDPEKMGWRDTDVRIEGPVVAQFETLWEKTWRSSTGPPCPRRHARLRAWPLDRAGDRRGARRTAIR